MLSIFKNKQYLFSILLLLAFTPTPQKKIYVWLIGDSTMCTYEASRAPLTGWGMPFVYFFDSTITINNRAKGGRSTRTFISEGRWQSVADSMQEGDYVLIQFGHNDEAKEPQYAERYTPVGDYKKNLIRFISETKARKANPVLITPVTRMKFDKGNALETHIEYSAAVWEVGTQMGVPVIDLDKKSRELLQQLGPDGAKHLFMHLEPDEHPHYPEGQKDNTHFNYYGARRMAELVLAEIKNQHLELAKRIVKRK
jgi:lysophospholipase L1-like esterase